MNMLLRNLFYAFGIIVILFLATSNPDTVQFKDLALAIQAPNFASITGILAVFLCGLELLFSGFGTTNAPVAALPVRPDRDMRDFWTVRAVQLAQDLDHWTPEQRATAEMPEIERTAGAWFGFSAEKTKATIVAIMRLRAKANR